MRPSQKRQQASNLYRRPQPSPTPRVYGPQPLQPRLNFIVGRDRPRSERAKATRPERVPTWTPPDPLAALRKRLDRASFEARKALQIIYERPVYRIADIGYYWRDWFMQGVDYISQSTLKELRSLKLIHTGEHTYKVREKIAGLLAQVENIAPPADDWRVRAGGVLASAAARKASV